MFIYIEKKLFCDILRPLKVFCCGKKSTAVGDGVLQIYAKPWCSSWFSIYLKALSKSLPHPSQKYPSFQKCPFGYLFRNAGHNRKIMYDDNPLIICISIASEKVLGQFTIKWTWFGRTFKIIISILCRLHASSIEILQKIFIFSFRIMWYRYFGVIWIVFRLFPTEFS